MLPVGLVLKSIKKFLLRSPVEVFETLMHMHRCMHLPLQVCLQIVYRIAVCTALVHLSAKLLTSEQVGLKL